MQNDNATTDLFYNNRIVLRGVKTSIPFLEFPFIDKINVLTGEKYDDIIQLGGLDVCINGNDTAYYDNKGNILQKSDILVTSTGRTLFVDDNGRLGIRDIKTGKVIKKGTYLNSLFRGHYRDHFFLMDSGGFILVNDKGAEIVKADIIIPMGDFVWSTIFKDDGTYEALTAYSGEVIIAPGKYNIRVVDNKSEDGEWFYWTDLSTQKEYIFNARTKTKYLGKYASISEGIIAITPANEADGYYFIDMKTGKKLPGKYKYSYPFSEGLAYVEDFNDNKYFIGKNGKIVIRCSELSDGKYYGGRRFSERTLGVNLGSKYAYIYNPLSNNQNGYGGVNGSSLIEEWLAKGRELFDTKPVEAKEYFYRVITNDPMNADGWVNYGACVYNLGYHKEGMEATLTALDIDPNEATALKNMQIMKENEDIRQRNEERQRQPQEDNNSFWDALSNIGNVMTQMFGGYGNSSSYYPSDQSYSGYGETSGSSRDYQSEYNKWEQRAMKNYNSLTTTGVSGRTKSGRHSGSTMQGMNGGNYVNQKRALREAQRQMRSIRQKARAAGINIPQSQWETATVSY